ncbi:MULTISPECIES: hypothetical protein [Brevundimonas]|uniref:Uncharacterized protein n=1 Tax=Brevundimonas bullata TaxID=13160 RepID=A0A7W7N458_9CAUL|nr:MULTISPECIES: hypothetical protein [Brevundimonas]MBB4799068.1 hypothetical protein [Brevundimonas bullata]MBB6384237.1 hypothetical protein [Brevundimonas bullata]
MVSLPQYLKSPEEWTAERVTARDVVPYRDVTLFIWCDGCRRGRELNVWTIGARLADDPLREVRFRCRACGVYPSGMEVSRRTSSAPDKLLMIPLKPRFWDDGHREDQAAALRRAESRRKAKGGA